MSKMKHQRKTAKHKLIAFVIFTMVAGLAIANALARASFLSIDSNKTKVSGDGSTQSDTTASGGSYVSFGKAAPPPVTSKTYTSKSTVYSVPGGSNTLVLSATIDSSGEIKDRKVVSQKVGGSSSNNTYSKWADENFLDATNGSIAGRACSRRVAGSTSKLVGQKISSFNLGTFSCATDYSKPGYIKAMNDIKAQWQTDQA